METIETRLLRIMAWERAKGELRSILHAYYNVSPSGDDNFARMNLLIEEFISAAEDDGLV